MSGERVPEGSGKQFGDDVADLEEVDRGKGPGTGKQFADDVAGPESDPGDEIPAGSGKQFAPGHQGAPDREPPESGEGFARGYDEQQH